jgi:hypothetical protein
LPIARGLYEIAFGLPKKVSQWSPRDEAHAQGTTSKGPISTRALSPPFPMHSSAPSGASGITLMHEQPRTAVRARALLTQTRIVTIEYNLHGCLFKRYDLDVY